MMPFRFFCLIVVVLFSADVCCAQSDWNQFRGSRADGKSDAKGVPASFGESKHVVWKTPIHGRGWSSPVVWGDQIWMQTATKDGRELFAVCVDARSGKIVFDVKVFDVAKPRFCHPENSYASPTPFLEQGRIYVHFGAYGTACLDTKTGRKLWERRDFVCDDFRGPASSPVIHGDLLFLNYDGVDVQYVVALDKKTGKTIWKQDRRIRYGTDNGDRKKAYGTPLVIRAAGRDQLISPSAMATISYDPKTGRELWRVRHGGMNVGARPLFEHGLVYISAGSGSKQLIAVRPTGKGNVTDSHIVWSSGSSVPRRSSQLIVGDLFFMINDKGVATCRDAKTGMVHWTKRFKGAYWASPVYADGNIYFFSKEGRVPVVKADKEFKLLAENQFDAGFNASPAFVGKAMIVRTITHLYRIEKRD